MVKVFFMSLFLVNRWPSLDYNQVFSERGVTQPLFVCSPKSDLSPTLLAKSPTYKEISVQSCVCLLCDPELGIYCNFCMVWYCCFCKVSRMDHPSVDTMFNYHILWEWQKNSNFHIKINKDRKKWFTSRSIILYPWNSRSQKLKKDLKIVMKLSLCQRDTLQHFLGAARQDGLVSAFVWPTRV